MIVNTGSLTLHLSAQFHTFQGNHQSLQSRNVCAAPVNNFSSNLVECIDFSGLSQGNPTTVFCKISVRRSKNCLQFSIT